MKKKIFLRGILGFPIGVAIGYVITILLSLIFANEYYSPCVPDLIKVTGSEINAVILQTLLTGILGVVFSASSVIWELNDWSIAKQTGVYFLIISFAMMPIAYFSHWMEHSIFGAISYFAVFIIIFVVIWITQFIFYKHNVKKMNENLHKKVK